MASEFPNSCVRHIYDELGERLEFNELGDVEERERLEVKPLPQSDALVELALNLHIADQHPDTQLRPNSLQDLKARLMRQNDERNPILEFEGNARIGETSIPFRTYARTRFAARAAVVAEFGEDCIRQPYQVGKERRTERGMCC